MSGGTTVRYKCERCGTTSGLLTVRCRSCGNKLRDDLPPEEMGEVQSRPQPASFPNLDSSVEMRSPFDHTKPQMYAYDSKRWFWGILAVVTLVSVVWMVIFLQSKPAVAGQRSCDQGCIEAAHREGKIKDKVWMSLCRARCFDPGGAASK